MKTLLITLFLAITTTNAFAKSNIALIRVYKSERRLELVTNDNRVAKTYKVMLGRNPVGHKQQEGDNKTPEGTYELDEKNPDSDFHRSFHISYPNFKDKMKARMRGASPGGDIMLHGLPNEFSDMAKFLESIGLGNASDDLIRSALPGYDWTNGCIAVTDSEIREIFDIVDVPTKIVIVP